MIVRFLDDFFEIELLNKEQQKAPASRNWCLRKPSLIKVNAF